MAPSWTFWFFFFPVHHNRDWWRQWLQTVRAPFPGILTAGIMYTTSRIQTFQRTFHKIGWSFIVFSITCLSISVFLSLFPCVRPFEAFLHLSFALSIVNMREPFHLSLRSFLLIRKTYHIHYSTITLIQYLKSWEHTPDCTVSIWFS